MCTKQDQEMEQGIELPVSHTLSDHRICHGVRPLVCHVRKFFFIKHELHVNGYCYWGVRPSQPNVNKHIADNNFVFQ